MVNYILDALVHANAGGVEVTDGKGREYVNVLEVVGFVSVYPASWTVVYVMSCTAKYLCLIARLPFLKAQIVTLHQQKLTVGICNGHIYHLLKVCSTNMQYVHLQLERRIEIHLVCKMEAMAALHWAAGLC